MIIIETVIPLVENYHWVPLTQGCIPKLELGFSQNGKERMDKKFKPKLTTVYFVYFFLAHQVYLVSTLQKSVSSSE